MFNSTIEFIKSLYPQDFIPLHEPKFFGNEKKYLNECIDSTFVSSVGKYVDEFEKMICDFSGSNYAVATMNGTAALHIALILAEVEKDDEVLTQALSFVATANAISYIGARPIFLDSANDNLGLCPKDLESYLEEFAELKEDGFSYNKVSKKRIKACVPMHTFGHPVKMNEILDICKRYNISVVEDAAESIGSFYEGQHTGTIAPFGIMSFNGNKTITSGGGGVILIKDEKLAKRAKHLTTTAKRPHKWDFYHDEIGYNYRLPNINAALACAQLENLSKVLENKKSTAKSYRTFFSDKEMTFIDEPSFASSNFWLNAIQLKNLEQRDKFLHETNSQGVMTRPIWKLMPTLPAFKNCITTELKNAKKYEETIVNIPSSVRL